MTVELGTPGAAALARRHADGPSVVAIGGGHGLARSLGAARRYARSITAVVSVADDGGSSGRLRRDLAIPAPGDVRRALVALLPEDTPLGRALGHRFGAGELEGHAFGNLLLAALAAERGDFVTGLAEACRILGTVGAVIPASEVPVVLSAEASGHAVEGQVRIMGARDISGVRLIPSNAAAPPAAIAAIAAADQIIIGPGSLYTSILAALAPVGVTDAISASGAQTVYIANLNEQIPETEGYDVGRHVAALVAHGITPDVVVADVRAIAIGEIPREVAIEIAELAGPNGAVHNEGALGSVLAAVYAEGRRQ